MSNINWALPEVTCECGCGEVFTPNRNFQKYKDDEHRIRYWARVQGLTRKLVKGAGIEAVEKALGEVRG